jgi:hypothetical protein
MDDEGDYGFPAWAGVVPLRLVAKAPVRDPRLAADVEAPRYVLQSRFHR